MDKPEILIYLCGHRHAVMVGYIGAARGGDHRHLVRKAAPKDSGVWNRPAPTRVRPVVQ